MVEVADLMVRLPYLRLLKRQLLMILAIVLLVKKNQGLTNIYCLFDSVLGKKHKSHCTPTEKLIIYP